MTLVDRHAPKEAMRIVVDAAERFNRKRAASKGYTSGILIGKHWVLHTCNFTEHFVGLPPQAYVDFPSALALQQAVRGGLQPPGPCRTMRPHTKARSSKARPSSVPMPAASDLGHGQEDFARDAPLCKHWVKHTCYFDECKYSHTGPGGISLRAGRKRLRRSLS